MRALEIHMCLYLTQKHKLVKCLCETEKQIEKI